MHRPVKCPLLKTFLLLGPLFLAVTFCIAQQHHTTVEYYNEVKKNIEFPAGFDKVKAEQILVNTAISKAYYFENGRLLNEEALQRYVNEIASGLLANDKMLLEKCHVYVVKNLSANAISYPDGSIFINLGLLLNLNNEAELAFIIGHELAHVKKQDALKEINRDKNIADQEVNVGNNVGRLYRYLSYSKENEYEADAFALNLLIQARYNPAAGITALHALVDTTGLKSPISAVLSGMLNSELSTFDTLKLKEKLKSNVNNNDEDHIDLLATNSDDFSTHPEIGKRMISLQEQMKVYEKNAAGNAIKEQVDFDKMKAKLAGIFIECAIDQYEYQTAFYSCLKQMEMNTDAAYSANALKCLYFIALARQNKYEEQMLDKTSVIQNYELRQLNNMFLIYDTDKFKKLVYGYAMSLYEKNGQNQDIHFYYALTTELYLGKQTSKIIFQNLRNKFPGGKYAAYVQTKLD